MEVIDFYIWNRYDATYTFYFWSFDGINDCCTNLMNFYIWSRFDTTPFTF